MPGDIFDQAAAQKPDIFDQVARLPSSTIGPKVDHPTYFQSQLQAQIPGYKQVSDALDKLHEWAGMTQEGKAAHPMQAEIGQLADRLKGMLVGGSVNKGNAIGSGEYGMLTNPVTSMTMGAPEDETINLARGLAQKGKQLLTAPFSAARATEAGRAITQTLAPETAEATLATTRGAGTTGGAATTSITNQDVIQHAADMGIKLTPAQALQTSAAKSEQVLGEEALLTGSKIKEAAAIEKGKLADQIEQFQDKLDPQRIGLSSESTGEHLQDSAEVARSVRKENVTNAYENVKVQQANLAGDIQTPMKSFLEDLTMRKQPGAAVARPVTQTAAAKSAIGDIQNLLEDPGLQGRASIESLRNLRTTLLEKGNDYGANALSDSGQRIYKLAAAKVDDAIMEGAKGTDFEETFRAAGQENKALQEIYNDRKSPLYRILNTQDPAKVTEGVLNRSSVHEIEALKSEGIDTGALARQTVEDIKNGGFKVTTGGLGGYPDTFLRSLLGPEATKELYLKADIARRLAENYNPSGSGKVVLGAGQLIHPVGAAAAQAARLRSMPKEAASYLNFVSR